MSFDLFPHCGETVAKILFFLVFAVGPLVPILLPILLGALLFAILSAFNVSSGNSLICAIVLANMVGLVLLGFLLR